jgi:hypothetical protein
MIGARFITRLTAVIQLSGDRYAHMNVTQEGSTVANVEP